MRNAINCHPITVLKDFGLDAGGWTIDRHVRLLADTTGDKTMDIVGFGEDGVWISTNNGNNTFIGSKMVLAAFSYSAGWRTEKHIRFMVDIRNIGRCDIVGFGDPGVYVSFNNGNGNFSPPILGISDFGYARGGWRLDRHLRFLADITGDGRPDIVAFGDTDVITSRNNGDGTFGPIRRIVNDFCYGAGWRIEQHPRFVADLTGDGRADIIGFGHDGVYVSLNNGSGSFGPVNKVVDGFAQTWQVDFHPRFIADLTGDKCGDIVGFAHGAVYVSLNNGDGTFGQPKVVLHNFCVEQGWQVQKHPRFLVDLTGNGCADIIGFGDNSVWASFNDGKGGFGQMTKILDAFTFNSEGEWSLDKTIRYMVNLCR